MDADKTIQDYIDLIERDPKTYEKDYQRVKSGLAKTNAYQFGKPIPFTYQPIFFSSKDKEAFEKIIETTLSIGSKVLDQYLKDSSYRKLFAFPPLIEELIAIDPGYRTDFPLARVDVFYQDPENFYLCEINTDGSAGMNADRKISQALFESKGLKDFSAFYHLQNFDLFDPWVQSCLEIYEEFAPGSQKPNVAIMDFDTSATGPDFEEFVRAFEEAGLKCQIVDPRNLVYRQGHLYNGDYRIDLIYRRMVTFEFIDHIDQCQDFIQAYRDKALCVVGSLRTQVIHNKLFFKILFDKATESFLDKEEIEFIKKHVPYTGVLGENPSDTELLKKNKDQYIVKPMDANKSTGVFTGLEMEQEIWEEALDKASNSANIFQEFIPPIYNPYVNFDNGSLEREKLTNMMGLFAYRHNFVGTYNRMGTSTIIKPGHYKVAAGILAIKK